MASPRAIASIALAMSCLSLVATIWPLWNSIVPFMTKKSSLFYLRPNLTNYLNLVCSICVFTLFLLFIILQSLAFMVYEQYYKITLYPLKMFAYALYLFQNITTTSFVLVVLNRYRVFATVIEYPKWTLPALVAVTISTFCVSLGVLIYKFQVRALNDDPVPRWADFLEVLIQFWAAIVDIFCTTHLVYSFLRRVYNIKMETNRPASKIAGFRGFSLKTQIISLLVLMITMDVSCFVIFFDPLHVFDQTHVVGQHIGGAFFGLHIVVGLAVLRRLKNVVAQKATSIELANSPAMDIHVHTPGVSNDKLVGSENSDNSSAQESRDVENAEKRRQA